MRRKRAKYRLNLSDERLGLKDVSYAFTYHDVDKAENINNILNRIQNRTDPRGTRPEAREYLAKNKREFKLSNQYFYAGPYSLMITLLSRGTTPFSKVVVAEAEYTGLTYSRLLALQAKGAKGRDSSDVSASFLNARFYNYFAWTFENRDGTDKEDQVEYKPLIGEEIEVVQSAPDLKSMVDALHRYDPEVFIPQLYVQRADKTMRAIFTHWGNTRHRSHAFTDKASVIRPRDDGTLTRSDMAKLRPYIPEKASRIIYVPKFISRKASGGIRPGKNRVVVTVPQGLSFHLDELEKHCEDTVKYDNCLSNADEHRIRMAGTADAIDAIFDAMGPKMGFAPMMSRTAVVQALRKAANASDEEVFENSPSVYTKVIPNRISPLLPPTVIGYPTKAPERGGIEAFEEFMGMLDGNKAFDSDLNKHLRLCIEKGTGVSSAWDICETVSRCLLRVRPFTDDQVARLEKLVDRDLARSRAEAPRSTAEYAPSSNSVLKSLMDAQGTRHFFFSRDFAAFVAKNAPTMTGNFQGPPSISVAAVTAVDHLRTKYLFELVKRNAHQEVVAEVGARLHSVFGGDSAGLTARLNDSKEFSRYLVDDWRAGKIHVFPKGARPSIVGNAKFGKVEWSSRHGGGALTGIIALCQFYSMVSTFDEAAAKTAAGEAESYLFYFNAALSAASTVTITTETLSRLISWIGTRPSMQGRAGSMVVKSLGMNPALAAQLARINMRVGLLTSIYGLAMASYELRENFTKKGGEPDYVKAGFDVVRIVGNAGLIYLMFVPNPPMQAAVMLVLVVVEIAAEIAKEDHGPAPVDAPVNNRLRQLLVQVERQVLIEVLTPAERASIQRLRDGLLHPAIEPIYPPGTPVEAALPFGRVALLRLRHAGFRHAEIQNFSGLRFLSPSDLTP